jgi:hypothetical protein
MTFVPGDSVVSLYLSWQFCIRLEPEEISQTNDRFQGFNAQLDSLRIMGKWLKYGAIQQHFQ